MVATRRAQASATPPTTPSAERHGLGNTLPHSAPGSGVKMSKELRRLTIDANPSLGGVASSSSSQRNTRRSGMRQELLPNEADSIQAPPHSLLPDGGVLLTPSPSDSPNSPHVVAVAERVPSPAAAVKQPQTSNPQSSFNAPNVTTKSPVLTTKSAGKRKITQYFSAMPGQTQNNKRRKVDNDHLHPPALQNAVSVPELPVNAPATLPTAASAPELKTETFEELDQKVSEKIETQLPEILAQALQVPQQAKKPDKPHDTDQEQLYVTAEEDREVNEEEDLKKKEEDEKLALKRERELKRLQIDAKPALIDKRSRRQTTLPPARADDGDARPAKRQRASLPAPASGSPSKVAVDSTSDAVHIPETIPETIPDATLITQALATPTEPNPPTFPPGTDAKLLASGEVNDEWLTQWLGYVAHITGDEETSKLLAEEDINELIKPDRSEETTKDRQKRISNEMDMVAGWNTIDPREQQEAIQSSPEQSAAPVKPPPKKKKQRFNPKPKGQPYIPKAKKKAQELAAKKLAKKKAETEIGGAQEETAGEVTTTNKETERVLEADQPAQRKEAEGPTDWLTDLMNATETVVTDGEEGKKGKKGSKAKVKAKVV
jgi:hypothetical protein